MKIFRNLDDLQQNRNCVLTTGTFDGVHLGHQSIIKVLNKLAKTTGNCSTIVTFEPHPQFVVNNKKKRALKLLTTLGEKIVILQNLKIDRLIIIPFTEQFSRLSSSEFIENILYKKIGFSTIIIGYDHAFGKDRQGNLIILENIADQYNFSITRMPPFSIEETIISSTKIRNLISNGDVAQAARLLGRNYALSGKVVKGEGRGRTHKIPTANIEPDSPDKLIPQQGIYAGWANFNNIKYEAVIYIGKKPTFFYDKLSIELFIFNFNMNIYGEILELEFKTKLRDDHKFETSEKLYEQIEIDKQQTIKILSNH